MVRDNMMTGDIRMISQYTQASAAKQSAAAVCDCILIVIVGSIAGVVSHSVIFAVLCAMQIVLILAVWEAVHGASPGRLLFGIRSVRTESVDDPRNGILPAGMARIARKYAVLGGSVCVVVIGLPIVLCSPLFARAGRGWADRVAQLTQIDIHQRTFIPVPKNTAAITDYSVSDESLDVHIPAPAVVPAHVPAAPVVPVMQQAPVPAAPAPVVTAVPTAPAVPTVPTAPAVPTVPTAPTAQSTRQQSFIHFANGTSLPLAIPSTIVLGRKPSGQKPGDITIMVPDDTGTVSRSHARLELQATQWWISDLGSTNGTRINDGSTEHVVPARQRVPITAGMRISLGETSCSIITTTRREI